MGIARPLILFVAVAVAAVGCSSENIAERVAEEALEAAGGGDVDIDFDEEGGQFSVETSEGTFEQSFGEGAEVPDDFPDDVPLPPGFDLVSAFTASDADSANWSLGFQGAGSVSDVAAGLKSDLEAAGFEVQNESTQSSSNSVSVTMILERGDLSVFVQVIGDQEQDDEITVSYNVTQETGSSE